MTSNRPKISVIVPIYNVEDYLRECLDSILGQTFQDIEVICIDDGSPDNSGAILDEYAARDPRIVAIHQENGGVGKANNVGVSLARGDYIAFIESDDWIEPDMLELLYDAATKNDADLAKAPFWVFNPKAKNPNKINTLFQNWSHGKVLVNLLDNVPKGVFTLEDYPLLAAYHASLWTYLYRADFVKEIPFMESRSASYQDSPFIHEVLCRAKRIVIVPKPLLHWRNEGSTQGNSTSARDRRGIAMVHRSADSLEIIRKHGKYDPLAELFWYHSYLACYGFFQKIDWKYKREMFDELRTLFLQSTNGKKLTFKYFDRKQNRFIKNVIAGNYWRAVLESPKKLRRFLFSLRVGKQGFLLQVLGHHIASGKYTDRPVIRSWHIGK